MGFISICIALALALSSGCVEKSPGDGKKIDPAYVAANLLTEAPTMQNQVNADLGGKVIYLGNDVDTRNLAPGGGVLVTHYWKVVDPPGSDWRVFSHVNGSAGEWINVDATDMRRGHPTNKWVAGQIIRDEQRFALTREWKSPDATLSVGLYRKGSQGIEGRLPIVSGPSDSESRVPVFRFKVDRPAVPGKPSAEYRVRRSSTPIVIDGKADDEGWTNAPRSPAFADTEGGKSIGQRTSARLLWDDQHLYAFIEVKDTDVFSEFSKRDDSLWKADVVELFIDADRNRRGYVELQVNPNTAMFDAWFPATRHQDSHFEWNSSMKSAVVVHGTRDNRDDKDVGWDVEIAIPLADVKGMDAQMKVNVPPRIGDKWHLNVVRVDKPKGDKSIRASSWNPITISDFHALDRMLTAVFADSSGGVKPPEVSRPESPGTGGAATDEAKPGALKPTATKAEAAAKSAPPGN